MAIKWFDQLKTASKERKRNVIILHFNIRDLVFDAESDTFLQTPPSKLQNVSEYLLDRLKKQRNWVLRYSASAGFSVSMGTKTQLRRHEYGADEINVIGVTNGDTVNSVMTEAATSPYPLINSSGVMDDPERPFTWRSPELTWPLLDRVIDRQWVWHNENSNQNEIVNYGLIIDYLDHLIPAQAHHQHHHQALEHMLRWSYSNTLTKTDSRVIALTSEIEAVSRDLYGKDSRIEVIEIPWPESEERYKFIKYLASYKDEYTHLAEYTDNQLREFANLTSGLNYAEIRDFALTVQPVIKGQDWKESLRSRRQEMIVRQSGSLLVPRHSKFGMDTVAGYDYVKELLKPRLDALRDGTADVSGILFTGPPGTGKSFFASCLARDIGIQMVTMQTIRGSYVGESERNFERVLRVATNMHPVIIFVDEIDQSFSTNRGSSGDGGVEQRLFGRLLEFMEDRNNLGKVLWLAASNRPDLLDAALLSRFRIRVPFLLPDKAAIKDMLYKQIPQQAGFMWNPVSWNEHESDIDTQITAKLLGKFSGREIDSIVRNAYVDAKNKNLYDDNGVNAQVLVPAIKAQNMSNYQQYILWSLYALRDVATLDSKLLQSIDEVLPTRTKDEVIIDSRSRLSVDGINKVISDIEYSLRENRTSQYVR